MQGILFALIPMVAWEVSGLSATKLEVNQINKH